MTDPETPATPSAPSDLAIPAPDVVGDLLERTFSELYAAAHAQMARVGLRGTMSTGTLVNETFLKIRRSGRVHWNDRRHFVAFAATAMRSILIDHLRSRKARGDEITLDSGNSPLVSAGRPIDLIALDDALRRLEAKHPRRAQVVEMRFFGGFSEPEVAEALEVSPATVKLDWRDAKRWLKHELRDKATP